MRMVQQEMTQSSQLGTAICRVHAQQDDTVGKQLQTHNQFADVFVFGQENPLLAGRNLQRDVIAGPRSVRRFC